MSYQVLARKYRPQNFDQVVGQEHVTTTLKNAILKNRLHHAYLFTGVRGTGKTSLARIFAKSLECEKGPTPTPCNKCSNCLAITQGNFLDVQEIDGASNTSVESVRELREQVKYMPAAGRSKIYIIDEVHMLSTSAFNALLKTLEEPPAHVMFLFATTEVQKIPVTILSRCQRFDLKRLSQHQILERLKHICDAEGISVEAGALDLLARSAEGSMRDSQSLLDMAIGLCGEKLHAAKILEMLGLSEGTTIEELTGHCLKGQLPEALALVQGIYDRGFDLRQVVTQWVEFVHDLALLKAAGRRALGEGHSPDSLAGWEAMVAPVDLDALQVFFQTLYRGSEEIFRSESPKILLDLLIVKLVHGTPYQSLAALLSRDASLSSAPSPHAASSSRPRSEGAANGSARPSQDTEEKSEAEESANSGIPLSSDAGDQILERALKKRPQIKALLDHVLAKYWEGSTYIVVFEKGSIWVDMFSEKRPVLAEALSQEMNTPVKVEVRFEGGASRSAKSETRSGPVLPSDPVVQQAVEILNATVQEVKKI